jgi:hypothetical protein
MRFKNRNKKSNKERPKHSNWQIMLGVYLLMMSFLFYFLHYLIFRDLHHIMLYLIGDIAFVFIEVLLVTLIIHRILEQRDKNARMEKLNMVIGAFFSEVGSRLLEIISEMDPDIYRLHQEIEAKPKAVEQQFAAAVSWLRGHKFSIQTDSADWESIKTFLNGKREFLLRLLENPNLLEHETFTDLLWAVFHLTEEMTLRKDFIDLPASDYQHLRGDMGRVYGQLVYQWLDYMEHLKSSYPYLFSLALRTNPFNRNASPIVREV